MACKSFRRISVQRKIIFKVENAAFSWIFILDISVCKRSHSSDGDEILVSYWTRNRGWVSGLVETWERGDLTSSRFGLRSAHALGPASTSEP